MLKRLFCLLVLFSLVACDTPSSSSAASAGAGDFAGYALEDMGDGLQRASKQDDKGQLSEEGAVLNGKKAGTWISYHKKDGLPATITSYVKGLRNGPYTKNSDRGNFEERGYYLNDQVHGRRVVYDRTRLIEEETFVKGKRDGTRKLYYKDGTLKEEGNFKAGQRHGAAKWFDEEGNVTIEYNYVNGERQ